MAAEMATELWPVTSVTVRLRALLEHAQNVKPETTVDPPLPISEFTRGIESLHEEIGNEFDQTYRLITVETAAREVFYLLIQSTDIHDAKFVVVWNLLDIILMCGDREKCSPELFCYLVEELLDSQTTEGCRTVFDYLDSRRERLVQKDFHKKNLIFLRSCNELLRRLSRAEDAIFCGRVFFFLFQTFPLGDKSSVNLRGEFHTENVTKFDAPGADTGNVSSEMEVDPKPETAQPKAEEPPQPATSGKAGSKAPPIKAPPKPAKEEEALPTHELYPIFWRLQHDFSDPTRLFDASRFTSFKQGLANTIVKFKKTPTVVQTKAVEEDQRGLKRKLGERGALDGSTERVVDNYNPKYLTSRDLFELELSDLAFQRHILVQSLILIDFLLSLTEKAKKRLAELSTTNKSMLYAFTLSEEDTKWATSTRSAITTYLGSSGEGRQYCRMVETVLARDKNWVRWKAESCPSIVRKPVSMEEEIEARKGAREATRPRRIPEKPMGAMDLSFLDSVGESGIERLKRPSRYTAPTVDELLEKVKTDKLDLEMAMDDEEKTSLENAIQNATWRALRQTRASNLSLLDKIESSKDLEDMFKQVAEQTDGEEAAEPNGEEGGPATNTSGETTAVAQESLPLTAEGSLEGAETR